MLSQNVTCAQSASKQPFLSPPEPVPDDLSARTTYHAPEMEGLMTYKQVAQLLSIGERTLQTLAGKGIIPKRKVGGSVRFHPDDVRAYINRTLVRSQACPIPASDPATSSLSTGI